MVRSACVRAAAAGMCILGCATNATADAVLMTGDRSPVEGCRIQIISGGRVYVQDKAGLLREFGLVEIRSLRFDDLPQLAEAEPLIIARRFDEGVPLLLRAAVDAKTNAQRIWALSLLSRAHAGAGQYVEAVAHAASVYVLDDSPHWKSLEPKSPDQVTPIAATYETAAEAMDRLQRARSAVKNTDLLASVDRMTVIIQPLYRQLAESHRGDPYRPNSTLSGIPVAVIRGEQVASESPPRTISDGKPAAPASGPEAAKAKPQPQTTRPAAPSPVSAEDIDSLLASGDFAKARSTCEAVARNPGDRDLARFLHQFGRSLLGTGQTGEAAVMFARCAVLFSGSQHSDQSLIELASIYAMEYGKPQTARRLLDRAIESATARGDSATTTAATSALDALGDQTSETPP
jgi:hypothetical protein